MGRTYGPYVRLVHTGVFLTPVYIRPVFTARTKQQFFSAVQLFHDAFGDSETDKPTNHGKHMTSLAEEMTTPTAELMAYLDTAVLPNV